MSVDSAAPATPGGQPTDALLGHRTLLTEGTRADMRQIIARYPQSRSALLPMLHLVQSVEGYVTQAGIELCAEELGLTTAEVSAVATFYTMYKRRPVGEYHVGVCTNTLCAVLGGDAVLHELEHHLGISHDETTEDGRVSLEHIECNAACDYAPVVTVNWEFLDAQSPASAREAVDTLRAGGTVHSTRGPAICTWRQASRVLAGFNDGRAGDGPAGGPPSLSGLRIARENDWRAPGFQAHDHADDRIDGASDRATRAATPGAATAVGVAGDPAGQAPDDSHDGGARTGGSLTGGGLAGAVGAAGHWVGEHLRGDRPGPRDRGTGQDGADTHDEGEQR